MATEWYYTTNKQQMGPVTWTELRELAEGGILKTNDMVWSEGMDEWVKAINQQGLFADGDVDTRVMPKKKASYAEPKPPPGRRSRRAEEEDDEDGDEDERQTKKKKRQKSEEQAKMAVGVKVGLILGGIFLLLLLGGGCVVGMIWVSFRGDAAPKAGPGQQTYVVTNLNRGNVSDRRFNFTQGRRVIITVNNTDLQFANTDVDLHVFRGNEARPFIVDVDVPAQTRNCRVEFVVPANDSYKVRVHNVGPGVARRCEVTIEER
ncbi:MAG: DUF4339 domain-containing protein [Planctomycetes bacterium]|nr:DUF4339 domain-containing protein [Planctomycetota bacterium]